MILYKEMDVVTPDEEKQVEFVSEDVLWTGDSRRTPRGSSTASTRSRRMRRRRRRGFREQSLERYVVFSQSFLTRRLVTCGELHILSRVALLSISVLFLRLVDVAGTRILRVGGLRRGAREFEHMSIGFFVSLLGTVRFSSLDGEVSGRRS